MPGINSFFSRPVRPRLRDRRGRFKKMPRRPMSRIQRATLKLLRHNPYTGLLRAQTFPAPLPPKRKWKLSPVKFRRCRN